MRSRRKLANLLATDKPPFILTVLFAALAWGVVRYADSLATSPVIEYDTKQSDSGYTIRLENLTQSKNFSNLEFIVLSPLGSMSDPRIDPVPPAWEGEIKPYCSGRSCVFWIAHLQPRWVFRLVVATSPEVNARFYLGKSADTVKLVGPSIETLLLRYQYGLLFGLIGAWSLLTVFFYARGGADEPSYDLQRGVGAPRRHDRVTFSTRRHREDQNSGS